MINRNAICLSAINIFFVGTMGEDAKRQSIPNIGAFYRVDDDLKPVKEIAPVSISNGLAWNIEDDTFYYIDSPTRQIAAYDYDPNSGEICKLSVWSPFKIML